MHVYVCVCVCVCVRVLVCVCVCVCVCRSKKCAAMRCMLEGIHMFVCMHVYTDSMHHISLNASQQ
jgi:hypothetical protein